MKRKISDFQLIRSFLENDINRITIRHIRHVLIIVKRI